MGIERFNITAQPQQKTGIDRFNISAAPTLTLEAPTVEKTRTDAEARVDAMFSMLPGMDIPEEEKRQRSSAALSLKIAPAEIGKAGAKGLLSLTAVPLDIAADVAYKADAIERAYELRSATSMPFEKFRYKRTGLFEQAHDYFLKNANAIRKDYIGADVYKAHESVDKPLWGNWSLAVNPAWAIPNITQAFTSLIPQIAIILKTGNVSLALATGSAQEAGPFYAELIEDGVDPDIAHGAANTFALGVGFLNNLGLKSILGPEALGASVSRYTRKLYKLPSRVRGGLGEGGTEFLEEPLGALVESIAKGLPFRETVKNVFEALKNIDVAYGAIVSGGAMARGGRSTVSQIQQAVAKRMEENGATEKQIWDVLETVDVNTLIHQLNVANEQEAAVVDIAIRKVKAQAPLTDEEAAVVGRLYNRIAESGVIEADADATPEQQALAIVDLQRLKEFSLDTDALEKEIGGKPVKVGQQYSEAEVELERRTVQEAAAEDVLAAEKTLLGALETELADLNAKLEQTVEGREGVTPAASTIARAAVEGQQDTDAQVDQDYTIDGVAAEYGLDNAGQILQHRSNIESALINARSRIAALEDAIAEARGEPTAKTRIAQIQQTVQAFNTGVAAGKIKSKQEIKAYQKAFVDLLKRSGLPKADQQKFFNALTKVNSEQSLVTIGNAFVKRANEIFIKNETSRLRGELSRAIKGIKPIKASGLSVSPFDYTTTVYIDELKEINKLSKDTAQEILNNEEGEPKDLFERARIQLLAAKAGGAKASPELLAATINSINELKRIGRKAKSDADFKLLAQRKKEIQQTVDSIKNRKGVGGTMAVVSRTVDNINSLLTKYIGKDFAKKHNLLVHENRQDQSEYAVLDAAQKTMQQIFGTKNHIAALRVLSEKKFKLYGVEDGVGVEYDLSTLEVMDIYNSIKNKGTKQRYFDHFGRAQVLGLTGQLTPQEKAFGDYMMEVAGSYWDTLNARHVEMTGRELGTREDYWPRTSRKTGDHWDTVRRGSTVPSAMKHSPEASIPPKPVDAWGKFRKHIRESEHVKHMSRPFEELKRVIASGPVRQAITKRHGKGLYDYILARVEDASIDTFQARTEIVEDAASWLLNNWVVAKIAAPTVALSQMSSTVLYANHTKSYTSWAVGTMEGLSHPVETFKFMMDGAGLYFKERYYRGNVEALSRAIEEASELGTLTHNARMFFSTLTRSADATAQIVGGYALVKERMAEYEKTMSPEQAKAKAFQDFVEISLTEQQARQRTALSGAQQSRGIGARLIFAFANTVNQFVRKQADAYVMWRNGEITSEQFAKMQFMYGIVMPVMYVWARELWNMGFRIGRGDDPEEILLEKAEETALQILTQPLGAVPITQGFSKNLAKRYALDRQVHTWFDAPMFSDLERVMRKFGKKEPSVEDILEGFAYLLEPATAMPFGQIPSHVRKATPRDNKKGSSKVKQPTRR